VEGCRESRTDWDSSCHCSDQSTGLGCLEARKDGTWSAVIMGIRPPKLFDNNSLRIFRRSFRSNDDARVT
jgi:hypothetical protein